MPRTRKRIKSDTINTIIKEEDEEKETKVLREKIQFLNGLLKIKKEAMKKCCEELKMERLLYSEVELKRTMKELKTPKLDNSIVVKTTKQRSVMGRSVDRDEGYVTSGSSTGSTRTRNKGLNSTNRSRSASRSKKVNNYSTPLNPFKGTAFPPITPKVEPNTPAIVLRKPVQGETVLSMQGSPLLVATSQNENHATVNVPLQDGRVFAIQAERGLRLSQLPNLDKDIQYQLEILRQNLNRVCSSIQKK